MRVICSLATGRHVEMLEQSAPTLRAYADRWGWEVEIATELLSDRPPAWSKIKLVRRLLDEYDYVFWVDADALFVNIERDVLAEIDESADVWLVHHWQYHDEQALVANAGVMVLRSTQFARDLLDAIWEMEEYIDHDWWENAALLDLLGYSLENPFPVVRQTKWQHGVGRLDLAWNSVPEYCASPTPVINHLARGFHADFDVRLSRMVAADKSFRLA